MNTSNLVKQLCKETGISLSELSRKIGDEKSLDFDTVITEAMLNGAEDEENRISEMQEEKIREQEEFDELTERLEAQWALDEKTFIEDLDDELQILFINTPSSITLQEFDKIIEESGLEYSRNEANCSTKGINKEVRFVIAYEKWN